MKLQQVGWELGMFPDVCLKIMMAAAAAKSCQLCPTLCDPIDGSPAGFSIHRISRMYSRQEYWSGLPLPFPEGKLRLRF